MAGESFSDRLRVGYLSFLAKLILRARAPRIIGITGTVGKTTTARVISETLMHPEVTPLVGRVASSAGNMNNREGVALTILRLRDWLPSPWRKRVPALAAMPVRALRLMLSKNYPMTFVLEMGTSKPGLLAAIVKLARPEIGVVTTIGAAHLEGLGTVENVYREKASVPLAVPHDGLVITGDEHDYVARLQAEVAAPVVVVSGEGEDLAREIARVIGRRLGLPGDHIERALAVVKPPRGRLSRIETGELLIIDDTYNANPLSMKLGLRTLANSERRRVAILGDMKELGDGGAQYHHEVGAYARGRVDLLVGVGELAKGYAADRWFASVEGCAASLGEIIAAGDEVLVKGSHSMRMSHLVKELQKLQFGDAGRAASIARASS